MLKKYWQFIMSILFPIECAGCGEEGKWLCDECFAKIKFNNEQICPICSQKISFGYSCKCSISANADIYITFLDLAQNSFISDLIHEFKYNFVESISLDLAKITLKFWEINHKRAEILRYIFDEEILFLPVPLHKKRLLWRGFNQSEMILNELNFLKQNWMFEKKTRVLSNALVRIKNTEFQGKTKMPEQERRENIRNAFECRDISSVKNKNVILFDDVITTGATIEECALVLKSAGAKRVIGMGIAKG